MAQARSAPSFCCIQQRYTYLRPRPGAEFGLQVSANTDLLDYCAARGMTLLPYSPLLGGSYVRPDKPRPAQYAGADSDARQAALESVAAETGSTVHQVILAWMLHHAQSVLPVFSARDAVQMHENLGALEVTLTDEQMSRLNDAAPDEG